MTSLLDRLNYDNFLNARHPSLMLNWLGGIHPAPGGAAGGGGYSVDNSVMTDDASAMGLIKTFGSAGTSNKTFTVSCWFKIANLSLSYARTLWCFDVSGSGQTLMELESDDTLRILMEDTSNAVKLDWNTTQVFRDPHAWYHAVWTVDTTPSTPIAKLWINGSEVDSFTKTTDSLAQNDTFNLGSTSDSRCAVGIRTSLSVQRFTGYISEMVYLDGSVVSDATSFGEYSDNGVWRPIDPSGLSFGSNGFYLDFTASGDLGNDVSGNANDFATSGSPSQSSDTPTNVFATLTPLWKGSSVTLAGGNLSYDTSTNFQAAVASMGVTSGKWYWEV
ncbi:MAG: LamG-like jellyroll fold domain-containing protein, partial [Candidatus Thalassarchaeaceae archaeon]